MWVKILGLFDIISAVLFWFFLFFGILQFVMPIIAIYLLVKGTTFFITGDKFSILDVISGGLIYSFITFAIPKFIGVLVVLYVLQKGILSLL
ncbi:MAG: hypothetical protein AABX65_00090 [Nanoarchaeota archaeon]